MLPPDIDIRGDSEQATAARIAQRDELVRYLYWAWKNHGLSPRDSEKKAQKVVNKAHERTLRQGGDTEKHEDAAIILKRYYLTKRNPQDSNAFTPSVIKNAEEHYYGPLKRAAQRRTAVLVFAVVAGLIVDAVIPGTPITDAIDWYHEKFDHRNPPYTIACMHAKGRNADGTAEPVYLKRGDVISNSTTVAHRGGEDVLKGSLNRGPDVYVSRGVLDGTRCGPGF